MPGDPLRLDGKVAVVTGAAQRIGREIATVFAEQGATSVVADIQDARGQEVVAAIRAGGGSAAYIHADVARHEEIRTLIEQSVATFGRLDILVNNAHWEVRGDVTELTEEDWDRSFAVLLKAAFLGCKYAIPEMRRLGGGNIVNISSVHAFHVSRRYPTYETAKAGLLHFTRQVAHDFGKDNIRCNAICPGDILMPDLVASHAGDAVFAERQLMMTPLRRFGHPRDIANAALFLVSDLAGWVTGQALTVDGGEFNSFWTMAREPLRQFWKTHPDEL